MRRVNVSIRTILATVVQAERDGFVNQVLFDILGSMLDRQLSEDEIEEVLTTLRPTEVEVNRSKLQDFKSRYCWEPIESRR